GKAHSALIMAGHPAAAPSCAGTRICGVTVCQPAEAWAYRSPYRRPSEGFSLRCSTRAKGHEVPRRRLQALPRCPARRDGEPGRIPQASEDFQLVKLAAAECGEGRQRGLDLAGLSRTTPVTVKRNTSI